MTLIIASNRLPYKIENNKIVKSAGGLASCLNNININFKWIGWLNIKKEQKSPSENIIPIMLNEIEETKYYNNFCNKFLWYIFHGDKKCFYNYDDFEIYKNVNNKFANCIFKNISSKNDIIFINDFHLLLVGQLLKVKFGIKNKIIYFHHIQVPNYYHYLSNKLPFQIINSFKFFDLVSFHTKKYCENFYKLMKLNNIDYKNILINPIGINYDFYHKKSLELDSYKNEKIIILGIDRLDHIKGLNNKFDAINLLLKNNPELVNKIQLFQLIVPSREAVYKKLKYNLLQKISKINSIFSDFNTDPPIKMKYGKVNTKELVKIYKSSDICLITSIADGMNLVSLEYLACNPNGILCLSNKTGSSKYLKKTYNFNPSNIESIVNSIKKGIKKVNKNNLKYNKTNLQFIKKNTSSFWLSKMIYNLKKNLLILDYDGTLINFFDNPINAYPREKQIELLKNLVENSDNIVFIVSGREKNTMEKWFGNIKGLGLSAEHGEFIKYPYQKWSFYGKDDNIDDLCSLAKEFVENKNIFLEIKKSAINFNFNKYNGDKSIIKKEVLYLIEKNIKLSFTTFENENSIEFLFSNRNKGDIVNELLDNYSNIENVYAFGDEQTDEFMFKKLTLDNHHTFKVGTGKTNAKNRCDDYQQVHIILNQINKNILFKENKRMYL